MSTRHQGAVHIDVTPRARDVASIKLNLKLNTRTGQEMLTYLQLLLDLVSTQVPHWHARLALDSCGGNVPC
jgi:hypothetical protein